MFRPTWFCAWGPCIALALSASVVSAYGADNDPATQKKPTPAVVQGWVTSLGSTDFQVREEALDSLIEAGKPAIAPLAVAVMSNDPEVAWRAATALEAIGLTGDEATLAEIKTRMEKTKGTPHRDLAAVLVTLSQRWGEMQRVKAQTALVKLGATFPNVANGMPMPYGSPAPVYFGSYAAPSFASSTIVIDESFSTPLPFTPPPATVVEFDPLTLPSSLKILSGVAEEIEKRLDVTTADAKSDEKKADADSEKDDKKKKEASKSSEKTPSEKSEAAATDDKKRSSDKPTEPKSEEPKEDKSAETSKEAAAVKELALTEVIDVTLPADVTTVAPAFTFTEISASGVAPTAAMYPGSVRLDNQWRGGDEGLVHLTALTNIISLDIQDAPITDKAIEYFKKMPALNSIMIRDTKITPEALIKFAKDRPEIQIRGQSKGVLGINSGEIGSECVVSGLSPGSAAGAAGVQQGDTIIKIDGKSIETFGQLTIQMMNRAPGDEVKIAVKRGEETLEIKVKLSNREAISR